MQPIDWDVLIRHLAGMSTPSDEQRIERMAADHPIVADLLATTRDIARDGDAAVSAEAIEARLGVVKRAATRAAAPGPEARHASRSMRRAGRQSSFAIAAGIALLAAGGAATWILWGDSIVAPPSEPAYSVVTTALGQRLSLRLADSTEVLLAPGSRLRTRTDFGRRHRTVELEGEAMFTVARDASRQFIVRTSRAVAVDLGTRFVVRAYADDPVTDIVVAEGRVAAWPADPDNMSVAGDSLILQRGQRARVASDGRMQFTANAPLEEYLDWTEGRLRFNGTPLRDAVRRLERWYDIDIGPVPEAVGDRPIVATVTNEPAADVLTTIALSLDLRLTRTDRTYTLTAN